MNILLLILTSIIIYYIYYYYYYDYKYANQIISNLWLGNRIASQDKEFIQKNNIQLIINCSKNLPFINLDIKKYRLNIHDNLSYETHNRILNNISEIKDLIDNYLKSGKGVLIHCHAGMQRAATVTACYLMYRYLYNVEEVIQFIRKKRKIAFLPRVNYYNVLLEFKGRL